MLRFLFFCVNSNVDCENYFTKWGKMATTAISHIKTTFHKVFLTKSVIWVFLALIFVYGSVKLPNIVPYLVGGLGLFLFGMVVMSDGLQAIAGARMRKILTKIVGNRFSGIFTGFTVTAVIQSSSATTVMTVGFVNAKLMTVRQAIGIIIGANIGTTVTAHMIALNLSDYAAPIIGVAVFIVLFAKNQNFKNMGNAILGFGLLFLGMLLMKDAVKPLRTDPFVQNLLTQFNDTPILALFVGMLVTMLIQSSSATEGLIASLALQGALGADLSTTLNAAIPMLLGSNIGYNNHRPDSGDNSIKNCKTSSNGAYIVQCGRSRDSLPFPTVLYRLCSNTC